MTANLHHAWLLRLNQDIEGCGRALASLPESEQAAYLKASLARACRRVGESNALLEKTRAAIEAAGGTPAARFFLERALNAYFVQDYFSAFQDLLKAATRAEEDGDRLVHLQALLNSLFCLKSLELPFEKTLRDFEKCLARYPRKSEIQGLVQQYDSFRLRRSLQAGDLAAIAKFPARELGQPLFQKLWFLRLPYHAHARDVGEELERVLTSPAHLFQKFYRVRTLQAVMHPEDASETRLSDLIDRLYLWTWDWLSAFDDKSLARVMVTLRQIRAAGNFHRMTAEDHQLLALALGWVGLFDPRLESEFENFLASVAFHGAKEFFPLFHVENLSQAYFRALRDRDPAKAEDFLALLRKLPVYRRTDLHFSALVERRAVAGLEKLAAHLAALAPGIACEGAWLSVDLRHFGVRSELRELAVESEPLARAFRLLAARSRVAASELHQFCFAQRTYDAVTHLPKLYNLLARLRAFLPEGRSVHHKAGVIFTKGDWRGIRFSGDLALADRIRVAAEAQNVAFRPDPSSGAELNKTHAVFERLLSVKLATFTRAELETHLATSRASCNRLIHAWQSKGLIQAKGKGRNIRYRVLAMQKGTCI